MIDDNTKRDFIKLRAAGWSYQRISAKLHTAKATLIG